MMPNANNLALTLGTETGKTQTKNSKGSNVKKEDFLKLFGKIKKEEKKKTTEEMGLNIPQFKVGINPFNGKNSTKTDGNTKIQVADLNGKNLVENLKTTNTETNLGKRIESTKSTNLKLDKSEEMKLAANVQNLKKENFKGEIPETSKTGNLGEKEGNFSEVQNKGK